MTRARPSRIRRSSEKILRARCLTKHPRAASLCPAWALQTRRSATIALRNTSLPARQAASRRIARRHRPVRAPPTRTTTLPTTTGFTTSTTTAVPAVTATTVVLVESRVLLRFLAISHLIGFPRFYFAFACCNLVRFITCNAVSPMCKRDKTSITAHELRAKTCLQTNGYL